MHNHLQPCVSLSLLFPSFCHDNALLLWLNNLNGVMFLYHASISLSFFLLFLHVSSILLAKLFTFLHNRAISNGSHTSFSPLYSFSSFFSFSCRHVELNINTSQDDYKFESIETADEYYEKEDLVADVLEGETLLFLYKESVSKDTLLLDEVKDSKETVFFEEEDSTVVAESAYYSPQEDLAHDKKLGIGVEYNDDTITNVLAPSNSKNFTLEDNTVEEDKANIEENVLPNIEEKKDSSEDEKPISIKNFHPRLEKFHLVDVPEERENYGESLTRESTSKSSVEWRSSTIFRDSETEYPFSSSSRRSSSRWESYTVFPKYNEGMVFLDRISAQKLSETESLRSIKVHPRSISERIVHKLSTNKPKNYTLGRRDPYQELESAYVAQICLAWEALNWNYTNFRQKSSNNEKESSGCPDHIAQQFQQFQVLLQRFIENEPYEYGRRPEVFARRRFTSPMLLQVPEFRDSEDEGKKDMSSRISSTEFLVILEDTIRTFMNFLKADKEKCGDIIRVFIKKKASSSDPVFLRFLKKANRRKKLRLKDIGRRHRCIRKRKLTEEEEMEILLGLIDLKVVSRVLRMADISNEQLHWCEEKMSRVRVWDGKTQRDSAPLFFPVH